ncbi:hypothetical protein B0H13DRAFT_2346752 [Mycena leptocephala]|nr:hypothetical protein B0H13DRAFT_2346752 [Mycena leptocephala]
MASTPTTPSSHPLGDIFGAMNEESPVAPSLTSAQKRTHAAIDGAASDNEDNSSLPALALTANQNVVSAVQRYSEKKRLRVDQATEVNLLLKDPPAFRHAKMLANLLHISNQLDAIVTAQPPFEVSADLEKNIQKYAAAVLLSSKISAYKGAVPTNILLNILKKHRFGLPPDIENNPANFAKVVGTVQEAFTQLRAKFKKALFTSLKVNKTDKKIAPGPEHQNIFKLTQIFVDGTQCTVTIELCARVALMRSIFLQDSGPKFWDKLDAGLAAIRSAAEGNAKKITKAFRHILTKDQNEHGVKDYEISDASVDNFQQEVDDLIDAGATDLATSVAPQPEAEEQA